MRVLVTTDTITSTWTYTRELVSGLVSQGARVTLVSFGEIPLPEQISWMGLLHGLEYRPTAFRLEWMQEGEADFKDASNYLIALCREHRPDVLHTTQFGFGSLPVHVPKLVVAQGDLVSWWLAVHGREPKESRWMRWYRDTVIRGLLGADLVVAPSEWMLKMLGQSYVLPLDSAVVPNGRNPIFFNPYVTKEESILSVGRMWDAGKQVNLLTQQRHAFPVCIVGADHPVAAPRLPIRADVKVSTEELCVALKGPQTENQLRLLYSKAPIFAATARYDPMGLNAIEAALSRCALVVNDIPSFRESWGDAALYFETNNAADLSESLRLLSSDRELCRGFANRSYQRARERFTGARMTSSYLDLYRGLLGSRTSAVA
jgi:glycosyltransferase involved in cell wall biosynthesis